MDLGKIKILEESIVFLSKVEELVEEYNRIKKDENRFSDEFINELKAVKDDILKF